MAKLYAQQYILQNTATGSNEFFPGDVIPEDNPEADGWAASGAARWSDDDPPARAKAKLATADPGLPGQATGGEATGDDLVGKVPKTPQRKRRKTNGNANL